MATKWELPVDPVLAEKVTDHEVRLAERRQEMGLIGRLFGYSNEKSVNIAGFVLIIFVLLFCGELVWGIDSQSLPKKDALSIIGSFITLAIGYVFGRTTGDHT